MTSYAKNQETNVVISETALLCRCLILTLTLDEMSLEVETCVVHEIQEDYRKMGDCEKKRAKANAKLKEKEQKSKTWQTISRLSTIASTAVAAACIGTAGSTTAVVLLTISAIAGIANEFVKPLVSHLVEDPEKSKSLSTYIGLATSITSVACSVFGGVKASMQVLPGIINAGKSLILGGVTLKSGLSEADKYKAESESTRREFEHELIRVDIQNQLDKLKVISEERNSMTKISFEMTKTLLIA